jgi:hypothetical protein
MLSLALTIVAPLAGLNCVSPVIGAATGFRLV